MHFYHNEVGEVVWTAAFAGAGAALGIACAALPTPVNVMCGATVAALTGTVIGIFQAAFNRGGGGVLEFTYGGVPFRYMYVGDNWT